MNPSYSAATAYSTVGAETGVEAATPHKLILMLFEGAIVAVSSARMHMERKEIAKKGAAISQAISIIDAGLNASLDRNAGGEIAQNLASLYDYMSRRLLLANLNNEIEPLNEVLRLLTELKEAWEAIGKQPGTGDAAPVPPPARDQPRASISYGKA